MTCRLKEPAVDPSVRYVASLILCIQDGFGSLENACFLGLSRTAWPGLRRDEASRAIPVLCTYGANSVRSQRACPSILDLPLHPIVDFVSTSRTQTPMLCCSRSASCKSSASEQSKSAGSAGLERTVQGVPRMDCAKPRVIGSYSEHLPVQISIFVQHVASAQHRHMLLRESSLDLIPLAWGAVEPARAFA